MNTITSELAATDIRIQESRLDPAAAVIDQRHPAGEPILFPLNKGQTLRIVDLEGNQAADVLFYNRHDLSEHYSATTTMQRQGGIVRPDGGTDLVECIVPQTGIDHTIINLANDMRQHSVRNVHACLNFKDCV